MIFRSNSAPLEPPFLDDLTIPQFILDTQHPLRPVRKNGEPWLVDDDTGIGRTYEEIRARTDGIANALAGDFGIRENDVVCIYSPNQLDYPIAIWAVHRLGAIVSCANPTYSPSELEYQIKTSKSTLLIAHPASLQTALKASIPPSRIILFSPSQSSSPAPIQGHVTIEGLVQRGLSLEPKFTERKLEKGEGRRKLAFLSFSSGTTGNPKAVAIPHHNVIANTLQTAHYSKANDPSVPWEERRFREGDVSLGVLPLFHIYGLVVNLHVVLFCGLKLIITPKFDFVKMLHSIHKYKITHLWLVPPHAVLFCKHPAVDSSKLSHIRFVQLGAAPLGSELTSQFRKVLGPNAAVGQAYGMTETATTVTMFPLSQGKFPTLGSAGQLISSTEARVLLPDGKEAGYGVPGELVVRGPQCAIGYYGNEKATKETFRDGWVHTGDEVVFEKNGDMFIVDRLKEILKVRGYQVAPAELEGHLLEHPDIDDCGVIGIKDEFSGEVPFAFIVLNPKAKGKDAESLKKSIKKHVEEHKVRYKWLDGGIEFTDAIPKNPSGKILRRFLRERAKTLVKDRPVPLKAKI